MDQQKPSSWSFIHQTIIVTMARPMPQVFDIAGVSAFSWRIVNTGWQKNNTTESENSFSAGVAQSVPLRQCQKPETHFMIHITMYICIPHIYIYIHVIYVYSIMSCANYVIKPLCSATVQNFNLYWGHLAGPIHSIPKPPVPQWHEVLPWGRRRLRQYRLGFAWANLNIATQSLPLAFIIPSRGLIMMMNKRRRRRRRSKWWRWWWWWWWWWWCSVSSSQHVWVNSCIFPFHRTWKR